MMKTIQMTIDATLLEEVDQATQELHINRSAFIREALQIALQQHRIRQLEAAHKRGYHLFPVETDEFDAWEGEQQWGAA
jgi:metal-responsive CopG/Arc/MetJ family transcriptional regulator